MALQPDYIYTIYGLVIAVCSVSALIFFSKLVIKRQYKKSFTWLSVPWWEREEFSGLNPHNYDLWFRQHTGNGLLGLDEHLLGKLSGKELEAVFRLQVKGGRHSYRIKVFRGDGTAVANIG